MADVPNNPEQPNRMQQFLGNVTGQQQREEREKQIYGRFIAELEGIKLAVQQTNKIIPAENAKLQRQLAEFYEKGFSAVASVAQTGAPAGTGTSGASTLDDPELRRQAGQAGEQARVTGPRQPPSNPSTPPGDSDEDYLSGGGGGGRKRFVSGDWRRNVAPNDEQSSILSIPRLEGARFTISDLLNEAGDRATQRAAKREADARARAASENREVTPEDLASADKMGERGQRAYRWSHRAAELALVRQYAGQIGATATGLGDLGAMAGYSGPGASIGIGGMGFRIPFTGAQFKGLQEQWEKTKMRFSSGINGEQADTIFSNLYERGWTGGNQTNSMRDAAKQMMQYNTAVGSSPQYYDLLDKSTRQGQMALDDFNKTMKQVPELSKQAHVSIEQMLADFNAIGDVNREQGGTVGRGAQIGAAWAATTGLPTALVPGLLQNPMVQSMGYRHTGLLPWQQGLEAPGQRVNDISSAVMQMYHTIAAPGPRRSRIGNSSFYTTYSGEDQRIATLAQFFPELDTATLKNMVEHSKEIQTGASVRDVATQWDKEVKGAQSPDKLKQLFGNGTHGWGEINKMLHNSRTAKGDRMFSDKEIKEVQDSMGNAGDLAHADKQTAAKAADNALKKIEEIQNSHADDMSNGPSKSTQLLDLTPDAKRLVSLMDNPNAASKAAANAGGGYVNAPYGSSLTRGPAGKIVPKAR